MKYFYTYMLASKRNGTLYTGSTDDIGARVWQHKNKVFKGFTEKYGVDRLVWFEAHETREAAFNRERQIKEWKRAWKLELIEAENPDWEDLFETLNQQTNSPRSFGRKPESIAPPGYRAAHLFKPLDQSI